MPLHLQRLLRMHRLMDEANDGTQGGSGGGGSEGEGGKGSEGNNGGGNGGDNTPKLSDNEAKLLREVMQKKEKLKELEKKFEGIDPEKYRKLLEDERKRVDDAAEADRKAAEARGDFERVKAQMVSQHQADLKALKDQIAELSNTLGSKSSLIDELTVGNAFGQSRFIADKLNLSVAKARQIYGSHFEQQDGRIVAFDKPAGAAERTVLVDGNGNPLPFDVAIEKLVENDPDKDLLIKSSLKPGAGSGTQGSKGAESKKTDEAPGVSRIAAALSDVAKKGKK